MFYVYHCPLRGVINTVQQVSDLMLQATKRDSPLAILVFYTATHHGSFRVLQRACDLAQEELSSTPAVAMKFLIRHGE